MQIKLGEKLKALRIRSGKKQEELARALGVTSQAVSRWETGGSYPDLELLPSIANYFSVTIDELFGCQGKREKRVNTLFAQIQASNRQNNGQDVCVAQSIQFARECLMEFPEEKKLIYALASVLYNAGYVRYGEHHLTDKSGYDIYDVELHRTYSEWQEAIGLYEKALTMLEAGELRDQAVRELIQLYVNTGETEKAASIISTSPKLSSCREFLRINGCDGPERAKMYGEALLVTADHYAHLMISAVISNNARLSAEDSAEIIRNAISVYGSVCTDGNFGIYHGAVAHMYLYLSEHLWLEGNCDEAFTALESAYTHSKKYETFCKQADARYTAPLLRLNEAEFKKSTDADTEITSHLPEDWPWWCVPDSSKVKSEMEADPRWDAWVARTQNGFELT